MAVGGRVLLAVGDGMSVFVGIGVLVGSGVAVMGCLVGVLN